MKNFVIIGGGGYIAPRHMRAIKETGNNLIAIVDPFDSVGILDSFSLDCRYFKEFERFDRYIMDLSRKGVKTDYVSICSPNYLHDSHIRFGLRNGADIICEKPIVIKPHNLKTLQEIEQESKQRVNCILQLRLHPSVIKLKELVDSSSVNNRYKINLQYFTTRGPWYQYSWKGDMEKSGGLLMNIGIHFFDMLLWIFGGVEHIISSVVEKKFAEGTIILEKADVNWKLSIDHKNLPKEATGNTFRLLKINDEEFNFTGGFTDLHTQSYQKILDGEGFSMQDCSPSLNLVSDIMKKAS